MRRFGYLPFFLRELFLVVKSPLFLMLTFLGNGLIFLVSFVYYWLEKDSGPQPLRFFDAVWWGFTTAAATGMVSPVTDIGKVLSILLILMGLALFAMYTALFAETILTSKKAWHEFILSTEGKPHGHRHL